METNKGMLFNKTLPSRPNFFSRQKFRSLVQQYNDMSPSRVWKTRVTKKCENFL